MTLAVIKTGGKQYLVKAKDKLKIEKLSVGEKKDISFTEVLLVADKNGKEVKIGAPFLKSAKVDAKIIGVGKTKKVTGYHYKAKTRNKKKFGHRQAYTEVQISSIKA